MTTKTPSQLLRQLTFKAGLSNQVSIDALHNARKTWISYANKPTAERDHSDVSKVFSQLNIVATQICSCICRIDPLARQDLITLITLLKHSIDTGEVLEPMLEAANSDSKEVA